MIGLIGDEIGLGGERHSLRKFGEAGDLRRHAGLGEARGVEAISRNDRGEQSAKMSELAHRYGSRAGGEHFSLSIFRSRRTSELRVLRLRARPAPAGRALRSG